MYEKFLIGSKVCEKLEMSTLHQLKILAQVALTHPMSLQQLREVHVRGCSTDTFLYDDEVVEVDEDFLNKYLKVNLIFTAPFMRY
jgi:hypothetical protein